MSVVLFTPHDLPAPFWSRANQHKTCALDLDIDPSRIEVLHLGPALLLRYRTEHQSLLQ